MTRVLVGNCSRREASEKMIRTSGVHECGIANVLEYQKSRCEEGCSTGTVEVERG